MADILPDACPNCDHALALHYEKLTSKWEPNAATGKQQLVYLGGCSVEECGCHRNRDGKTGQKIKITLEVDPDRLQSEGWEPKRQNYGKMDTTIAKQFLNLDAKVPYKVRKATWEWDYS